VAGALTSSSGPPGPSRAVSSGVSWRAVQALDGVELVLPTASPARVPDPDDRDRRPRRRPIAVVPRYLVEERAVRGRGAAAAAARRSAGFGAARGGGDAAELRRAIGVNRARHPSRRVACAVRADTGRVHDAPDRVPLPAARLRRARNDIARASPLHAGRSRGGLHGVRDAADVLAVVLPRDGAAVAVVDAVAGTGRVDECTDDARRRGIAGAAALSAVLAAVPGSGAVLGALAIVPAGLAVCRAISLRTEPVAVPVAVPVRLREHDARPDQHDRRADRHHGPRPLRHRPHLLRHAPFERARLTSRVGRLRPRSRPWPDSVALVR